MLFIKIKILQFDVFKKKRYIQIKFVKNRLIIIIFLFIYLSLI